MIAMRALTHKTLRDLRRQRAQVVAVGVTVMLGVALFIASAGAFRNLSTSYGFTYDRLQFADLVAAGGDAEEVARAARHAGAATVITRTQADIPMSIQDTKLLGRVIGLPSSAPAAVDAISVSSGEGLSRNDPNGVLVERHAARTFGLTAGDTVRIFSPAGWREATIRGIARSPEYLWPARSRQDVLGDPHAFAVLFAPEQTARQWAGTGPDQVLVRLASSGPGGDAGAVEGAMRDAGATDVTTQADQASNATLHEDLNGFSELSVAFPLLFLSAAAVASYVLLARRVLAERPIIGTLMASGARRGRLVRHYLQQGTLVGLLGALAGTALGIVGTRAVTTAYTGALGIPDTIVARHADLDVIGLAFGVLVGLAGSAAPAIAAARTTPADAMRNEIVSRPPGRWSRMVATLRWIPVTGRMALRDVFRSTRRTLATMLGTVLAMVLMLSSILMLTSLSDALALQYGQIDREDATVTVDSAAAGDPGSALRGTPGVTAVERVVTGAVTATHGGASYTTVLEGLTAATTMHRFRATSGDWTTLPTTGVLAGAGLADKLRIHAGDQLSLSTPTGQTTMVRLAGLLDEPIGTAIYATDQLAANLIRTSHTGTYLVRFDDDVDRDALRRTITALPGVVAYADTEAVTSSLDQFLGLFWAFIGMMVLLGAVLAVAIIYVTMAVTVIERTNELATLRAAGVPLSRVAGTLATENLTATALGIPIGLAAGLLAGSAFLDSFSSDLFRLDLDPTWWALAVAVAGVCLAAAASQWPAVRAVRRLDIARVVRERSQ